jgi:predicted PurR-regulated permease PerM
LLDDGWRHRAITLTPHTPPKLLNEDLATRQQYAAAQWAGLRARLRTITPQAIGRAVLVAVVAGGLLWLGAATWPAAAPFIVGGLFAYLLLPLVDALDRVLPRWLAAVITVLVAVAAVVAVLAVVLPPLAGAFVRFAGELPTAQQIKDALDRWQAGQVAVPDGSQVIVVPALEALAAAIKAALADASGSLQRLAGLAIQTLLSALATLLGLIVLPTWLLTVLGAHRQQRAALYQRVAPGLRDDARAVVAIVDRAAGSYLRGYVASGLLVGIVAYIACLVSPRLGGPTINEPLAIATLIGAAQVIPVIGPILGLVPALLVLPFGTDRAVTYLVIYISARFIGGNLIGSRIMERRLTVHPAIMVPGIVLIGQFGLIWLLLAAPMVAIAVDLVRYFAGRLSEPPMPAGVLPGTTAVAKVGPSEATTTTYIPVAYRPASAPPPLASSRPLSEPAVTP